MNAPISPADSLRGSPVQVASGDALDVRTFHVEERINELFEISIVALPDNPDIDFEAVAGELMSFTVQRGHRRERTATTQSGPLPSHRAER
ncbi:MAG: hypothetical protein R3F14_17125 [Polyangiaceae bacterium]